VCRHYEVVRYHTCQLIARLSRMKPATIPSRGPGLVVPCEEDLQSHQDCCWKGVFLREQLLHMMVRDAVLQPLNSTPPPGSCMSWYGCQVEIQAEYNTAVNPIHASTLRRLSVYWYLPDSCSPCLCGRWGNCDDWWACGIREQIVWTFSNKWWWLHGLLHLLLVLVCALGLGVVVVVLFGQFLS